MKIFLNAGHGGTDPGATSLDKKLKESDVAANIVNLLIKKLKLNGYTYEAFQQSKSYFEISKVENKSKATLFISVHCNASINPQAHGVETLYQEKSAKGKQFAQVFQNELVKKTKLTNRGIKPRKDIHVLNRTFAPAVLIECAFISNPTEAQMLKNQPELFADAIFDAIKILNKNNQI